MCFSNHLPGATAEATVRLYRGAAIRGRILDARSGRPLAGARVRAHDQGYFHSTLITDQRETLTDFEILRTTDGDGRFVLRGLGTERLVSLRLCGASRADDELWIVNRAGFDYQRFAWSWTIAGARGAGGAVDHYPSGTLSVGASY